MVEGKQAKGISHIVGTFLVSVHGASLAYHIHLISYGSTMLLSRLFIIF